MSRVSRSTFAWLLAIGATVGLAALSRAPQGMGSDDGGLLRLSWTGQPERIEACRQLTAEETSNLPRHMRQQVVCEGRAGEYRLSVIVDGTTLADELVTGGGLRTDRPVYLYREFPLAPGPRSLVVRFDLAGNARGVAGTGSTTNRLDALPQTLTLDTTIVLSPRTVALVTYDADRRALIVRKGGV